MKTNDVLAWNRMGLYLSIADKAVVKIRAYALVN
jgi:hypothetical protein